MSVTVWQTRPYGLLFPYSGRTTTGHCDHCNRAAGVDTVVIFGVDGPFAGSLFCSPQCRDACVRGELPPYLQRQSV